MLMQSSSTSPIPLPVDSHAPHPMRVVQHLPYPRPCPCPANLFCLSHPGPRPSSRCHQALTAAKPLSLSVLRASPSDIDCGDPDFGEEDDLSDEILDLPQSLSSGGVRIAIEKLGRNSRRIQSKIGIDASLEIIWKILTDYERLADFIPGLAVSQLMEKKQNFARLLQIVVPLHEHGSWDVCTCCCGYRFTCTCIVVDHEAYFIAPAFFPIDWTAESGIRTEIQCQGMIEGDFQNFEGKWSVLEYDRISCGGSDNSLGQENLSILSYTVDVEPKLWLPVRLIEGRLCEEIKLNLSCIQKEAQKAVQNNFVAHCDILTS
ncbi:Coenzyme Q-binding protein COQ10, START domain [Dillenia turbinata]|uniref:Coenzyme Q-binding protein COQ10, START domain n=1 Tax=Dillenia turbinata TaxID=194707 RepID=A0AAN8W3Q8_9MAGN